MDRLWAQAEWIRYSESSVTDEWSANRNLSPECLTGTVLPPQSSVHPAFQATEERIGWHTFRHTYSTLLRSTGAELKIMQELLRHSTIGLTLDTYTQAVTTEKRNAQEAVVALLFPRNAQET